MDPQISPQPQPPVSPEPQPLVGPDRAVVTPEAVPVPIAPEIAPSPGAPSATPPPAVMPVGTSMPTMPTPVQPAPTAPPPTAVTAGPAIADDVDVIEKEWVEKAQEIVRATSEDPYAEEEAVEDLQIDYLKKRYGKEINKPESK